MKVPEKLYLHPTASGNVGASWLSFPLTDKDIEYTRADAVIDKAWSWIEDNLLSSNQQDKSLLYYEQFKNYMKGEYVMTQEEDKKVLNGYGVLFALCVAKESGKNPSEIIDLLNK